MYQMMVVVMENIVNYLQNKVDVINADGLNLPFKSNTFDLTISIAVLHHLSTD